MIKIIILKFNMKCSILSIDPLHPVFWSLFVELKEGWAVWQANVGAADYCLDRVPSSSPLQPRIAVELPWDENRSDRIVHRMIDLCPSSDRVKTLALSRIGN